MRHGGGTLFMMFWDTIGFWRWPSVCFPLPVFTVCWLVGWGCGWGEGVDGGWEGWRALPQVTGARVKCLAMCSPPGPPFLYSIMKWWCETASKWLFPHPALSPLVSADGQEGAMFTLNLKHHWRIEAWPDALPSSIIGSGNGWSFSHSNRAFWCRPRRGCVDWLDTETLHPPMGIFQENYNPPDYTNFLSLRTWEELNIEAPEYISWVSEGVYNGTHLQVRL